MYKTGVKIYSYLCTDKEIERVEDIIRNACNDTGLTVKSATTALMGARAITTVVYQWHTKRKEVE